MSESRIADLLGKGGWASAAPAPQKPTASDSYQPRYPGRVYRYKLTFNNRFWYQENLTKRSKYRRWLQREVMKIANVYRKKRWKIVDINDRVVARGTVNWDYDED